MRVKSKWDSVRNQKFESTGLDFEHHISPIWNDFSFRSRTKVRTYPSSSCTLFELMSCMVVPPLGYKYCLPTNSSIPIDDVLRPSVLCIVFDKSIKHQCTFLSRFEVSMPIVIFPSTRSLHLGIPVG